MTTLNFVNQGATARLVYQSRGRYSLTNVYATDPGQGWASKLIETIVDYADRYGYTISLIALQFRHPHGQLLNNDQLETFYNKFGFVRDPGSKPPHTMTRLPREKNTPSNEKER